MTTAEDLDSRRSRSQGVSLTWARTNSRVVTVANRVVQRRDAVLTTPFEYPRLSLGDIRSLDCDVVHLHNFYNLVSSRDIAQVSDLLEKPVLLTLHDERLLTGGCHYSLGCGSFAGTCSACPQVSAPARPFVRMNRTHMSSSLTHLPHLICPSNWMLQQVDKVFPESRVGRSIIPNCVPTDVFKPDLRPAARSRLGLAPESLVVALQTPKGRDIQAAFLTALESFLPPRIRRKTILLACGGGLISLPDSSEMHCINLGQIYGESELALFWAAADVAVTLTHMDNFPNAVLESLASGVPMVVPSVGGSAEAVEQTGGGLVKIRDPLELAAGVTDLMVDQDLRMSCATAARSGTEEMFSPQVVGEQFLRLYESSRI